MKILVCGDIVGRSGREVIENFLPELVSENDINFVIVNGENSASGFGITKKICEQLFDLGVDVITSGNHIWDQKEIIFFIENEKRLIRPCNYPKQTPGRGFGVYKTKDGNLISVINVMCRLFMDNIDDPFRKLDDVIEQIKMEHGKHTIIVAQNLTERQKIEVDIKKGYSYIYVWSFFNNRWTRKEKNIIVR